jgi:superfamily II DNA or RNA helicase
MAKTFVKPYYQKFRKQLQNIVHETRLYVEPETSGELFESPPPDAIFLKGIEEGITKFPFRYYQKDAIYTLHRIYQMAIDVCKSPKNIQQALLKQPEYKYIRPLLEKVDPHVDQLCPFIGFEMATGSGKTMLMGAAVYYLNQHQGIQNFLIITPSSTEIYKKTIRNFQKGTRETVWHQNVPFNFNLITGNNYKDTKDLYYSETDANIFVFNIDKFGTNATLTKKEWEGSIWKDNNDNTISLLEYLSQNDLVIITDEAHHAQSKKANSIIKAFKPLAVLEYTATAVETERNEKKKNQTIVYKYDIKQFLEDKYGKLVRVLALPGEKHKTKGKKTSLSEIEKYKLLTFFLVHLLKKKALHYDIKTQNLKAIGFVKVKNEIAYSEIVEDYIKSEIARDVGSLDVILEKSKLEDTETTNLIYEMYQQDYNSDISLLQAEIAKSAKTAILLHSKSDKIINRQFDHILSNEVEIVIFIDMLNEGIDMPNIYTMVVINDNPTEFKTSVKQIVGRGVRLNKFQRDYDNVEDNDLLTHTEKLHIICDKGASFEEVVMLIQKEFGLNDKTFAIERGKLQEIDNPVKPKLLSGIQLPKITLDLKRREGAKIQAVIQNYDKILSDFVEYNCFKRIIDEEILTFIKYAPDNFFTEVDLFTDEKIFHQLGEQQGWNYDTLAINEKDMKDIYGRVLTKVTPIPDNTHSYQIFQEYGKRINLMELRYYSLDIVDSELAKKQFIAGFSFFYMHYIENEYQTLDIDSLDSDSNTWLLQNAFKTAKIKLRTKEINNKSRLLADTQEIRRLIKQGYYFQGYENSIYEYDKFDSLPEKQLADYLNYIIEAEPENSEQFWLRNDRNIHFKYGNHKYYPDFIFFYQNNIYVIEVKAEKFSNAKKNRLLLELKNAPGVGRVKSYVGMVVYDFQINRLVNFDKTFDEFRREADEYFEQLQTKANLIPNEEVDADSKFKEYIPAFEPKQAYNKFILQKDPKSINWLKVESGSYNQDSFAILVKNIDVGHIYHNRWMIMESKPHKPDELIGRIVLCFHPDIEDETYSKNMCIRKFGLKEEKQKYGMFDETHKTIVLESEYDEPMELKDLSKFVVVGVQILS